MYHSATTKHVVCGAQLYIFKIFILSKVYFQFIFLVNWFKRGDSFSTDEQDNHDNGDSFTDTSSFIRQSSKNCLHKASSKR